MAENRQNQEYPNYWAVIPANVRYCKTISAQEKLLYCEITSLIHRQGYCVETNNYFAELYGQSKKTVSRQINNLAALGFIRIENTNEAKERRIFL